MGMSNVGGHKATSGIIDESNHTELLQVIEWVKLCLNA